MPTDDAVLRATLRWMGAGHGTPHDDEDLHPSHLDAAERELELALARKEAAKKGRGRRETGEGRGESGLP